MNVIVSLFRRAASLISTLLLLISQLFCYLNVRFINCPWLSDSFENPHIVRPLSDISVDGRSICGKFVIVTPDTSEGTVYGDAAKALRDGIYKASGIRLKITSSGAVPAFVISEAPSGFAANAFSLTVSSDEVSIIGGSDAGISRGITAFINEVLFEAEGDFNLMKGYVFEKTYENYTTYEDFGAVGDGKADDFQAIVDTHAYANSNGLSVLAREGAQYYIGGSDISAVIKTDTDWSTARFIIDDTDVVSRGSWIFTVAPSKSAVSLTGQIQSLPKSAENLGITLESDSVVVLVDSNVKRYIRYGANQNDGSDQTDVVVADRNGNISPETLLLWDFDRITSITAFPIDTTRITIRGGIFTTIANKAPSEYTYYNRGILINRSNTTVDGLVHHVTGEGKTGAPYNGFLCIQRCAEADIKNCTFTGHKTYKTIGSAGIPVNMGTYDISAGTAMNVTFYHCNQTNDITDKDYWGIFVSNYCKNLVYDGCVFSRFDAHMGVANATIKNSVLGHQGINLIGSGTALIENSTVRSVNLITLRHDYGSTWEGDLIIRNCDYYPTGLTACIINGFNPGNHDFGYTCYLPQSIEIDGLKIHSLGKAYLFSPINSNFSSYSYQADYPMVMPQKITVKGLNCKKLAVSSNKYMFKDVTIDFAD